MKEEQESKVLLAPLQAEGCITDTSDSKDM